MMAAVVLQNRLNPTNIQLFVSVNSAWKQAAIEALVDLSEDPERWSSELDAMLDDFANAEYEKVVATYHRTRCVGHKIYTLGTMQIKSIEDVNAEFTAMAKGFLKENVKI